MSDIHKGSEQGGFASDTGHEPGNLDVLQGEGFDPDAPALDVPVTGGPPKKRKGAIVLIVVIGLAIGSLFSMHTLTKVSASSGKSTDIQKIVDEYLNRLSPDLENPETASSLIEDHSEVVKVLTDDFRKHQVGELSRNPFKVFEPGVPMTQDSSEYSKAALQDRFETAADEMRLKSVIGGSRPLANLNGRIVRLNQTIPVELGKSGPPVVFTVIDISRDSVTVVAEEPKLGLRVERVIKLKP